LTVRRWPAAPQSARTSGRHRQALAG
jgi:hypothetical protein